MTTLLRIDSSPRKSQSISRDLADKVIARLGADKIIERDMERARRVSEDLRHTIVLAGDGADEDGVVFNSPLRQGQVASIDVLAPTDIETATGSYAITQADLDSGSVVNIASASADGTTSATDTATSTTGSALVMA